MRVLFDSAFTRVDHASSIPLYLQVVMQIDDAIRRGRLGSGTMLPPEHEMCAGFGIARSTLRRAFAKLEDSGAISRGRGRGGGTRIESTSAITRRLGSLETVHSLILATARKPQTQLLVAEVITVDESLSLETHFQAGTEVFHLLRHRSADGSPITVLENWVLVDRIQFDLARIADESLDALLQESGRPIRHVEFDYRPALAGAAAEFLGTATDAPVIKEVRFAFDVDGQYDCAHITYHPLNARLWGASSGSAF